MIEAASQSRTAPVKGAGGADLRRLIHDCVSAGVGRSAMLLRRSLLPPDLAQSNHLRLTDDALDPLLMVDRGRLFQLSNLDLVAVWRGNAAAAVAASLQTVAELFADTGIEPAALTEQMTLPRDAKRLLRIIDEAQNPDSEDEAVAGSLKPLDLTTLTALETTLSGMDVSLFARRHDVCAIGPNERCVLRWEHRYLSAYELAKILAPEQAIRRDPWLFLRLTRIFDQRMMALLSAPHEMRGAGPFQLSLNVSSILSAAFLRFDSALSPALRGEVVLGLLAADILADPPAFLFARAFARARGYRLLLRSVTDELVPILPLERLELDLLELSWSPSLAYLEALPAPPQSVILARTDTPGAFDWGRSQGIGLFRGAAAGRGRTLR